MTASRKPINPVLLLGVWCHGLAIPGKVGRRDQSMRLRGDLYLVMPGLVPGIHVLADRTAREERRRWPRQARPCRALMRHMRRQGVIGGLVEERGFLGGGFEKLLVLGVDVV